MHRSIERVHEIQAAGRDAYLRSPDTQRILERELQVVLQAGIDAATELLADRPGAEPRSFQEVFDRLAELELVPPDLALELHAAAELRNRLVFGYLDLEPLELFDGLGVLETVERLSQELRRRLDGLGAAREDERRKAPDF